MADKPPSATRPLPPGWKESFDENRKRWYFYNPSTKESQWHHPSSSQSEKKAVWLEKFDERYQRPYWYNRKTKQSSWTKPADESLVIKQDSQGSLSIVSTPMRRKSSSKGSLDVEGSKSGSQPESTNKQEENSISSKERGDSVSMLIRSHRKSSGSTESIASPLTSFPSRPEDRRRMVLKAMSFSQGDEKSEDGTSSPSMLPKSPHRKRSVLDPARALEQAHSASSFNSDRDKAYRHGGLFNKQLLTSMQSRSDEDIQISRQPYDRRHYSTKVPSNESLVEPTSPLEAPAERLPVGATGAEKDQKPTVKPNGGRRNGRTRGGGAFASMLNPSGGKKHHVILTSRVGHSTLHQRRKGNKSPLDDLYGAFADPLAEGDKRTRQTNAQSESPEEAKDEIHEGSDEHGKANDISMSDEQEQTEGSVKAQSEESVDDTLVAAEDTNVDADSNEQEDVLGTTATESESHDQRNEPQQESSAEREYDEQVSSANRNYDPLTTSESENEDETEHDEIGNAEKVQDVQKRSIAEIHQEALSSNAYDANPFDDRHPHGENDDPPEISPAERSSDGEDVSVTDNEKDVSTDGALEDSQVEPSNPFDDHHKEDNETDASSSKEDEEQWIALDNDGQNHELQEAEDLENANEDEQAQSEAEQALDALDHENLTGEDEDSDRVEYAIDEPYGTNEADADEEGLLANAEYENANDVDDEGQLEEPNETNEADINEVAVEESVKFEPGEPIDQVDSNVHEKDKADVHEDADTGDSENVSEQGEDHIKAEFAEAFEALEQETPDMALVQNTGEEVQDEQVNSEVVDQSFARRESEDELGVLPGAMEVADSKVDENDDGPKNENDDDLEPSIFEREFATKPGSSDDFRKRLNSVELVQKSQKIRERMEALARRPRPQLSFRKGTSSSSLPRTGSTEDALQAEQATASSSGIEPAEEAQIEEPKPAVGYTADHNPRKHALEREFSSTSKVSVQVVVEPATKRAAPPVSRGGSVKNLVAKFSSVAGGTGVPIQFFPAAFSVPPSISEESASPFDAYHEHQPSSESSNVFSPEEIKSALQDSTLVNDAHLTRAAIPRGHRRDPSRRPSNFAETLDLK